MQILDLHRFIAALSVPIRFASEPSLRGLAKKNARILVYSYIMGIVHLWESGSGTSPLLGADEALSVAVIVSRGFFSFC
ncbi:hypothetical protein JHL17_17450 [Azospirillum sp. YIM B02556]|uniref:Uncharacterized protein n=1 Tax=Azospirillum endophyticum TaxID=2800326 RepID=A0ABS1F719_9PROT|nr:hypothetical protein [Azospirillum endophyticum]MBK1839200.1 hypothetical protein [Azospirillum endophyticum]